MGLGTSIFLIAIGAILRFAVSVSTNGVNLQTIGLILMVVGAIGLVLSVLFWSSWGGFGGRSAASDVVVDDAPRTRRRVVRDEVV